MARRGLFLCAVLILAYPATADVVIDVLPPPGAELIPGEDVLMDIYMTNRTGEAIGLRGVQFDFGNSAPAIGLGPEMSFDYSSVTLGSTLYAEFLVFPVPSTVFFGTDYPNGDPFCPGCDPPDPNLHPWDYEMLVLPAEETPFHIGSFSVTIPELPGAYTLDAMNAPAYFGPPLDPNFGVWIYRGFSLADGDPVIWLHAGDPEQIAGGIFTIGRTVTYTPLAGSIVPEPATLSLLGLASIIALRRTRHGPASIR